MSKIKLTIYDSSFDERRCEYVDVPKTLILDTASVEVCYVHGLRKHIEYSFKTNEIKDITCHKENNSCRRGAIGRFVFNTPKDGYFIKIYLKDGRLHSYRISKKAASDIYYWKKKNFRGHAR